MAQSAPSDGSSGESRVLTVLAHSLIYVLGITVLVCVASWFNLSSGVDGIMRWVLILFFGVAIWHRLTARLCLRCMDEVPADAPVRAEHQRRLLRLAHFNGTWKCTAFTVALVIFGPVVVQLWTTDEDSPLTSAPGDVWVFAIIYAEWLHHRLRPWCPYCRDWDGDGDLEPSPDPTALGTKTAH